MSISLSNSSLLRQDRGLFFYSFCYALPYKNIKFVVLEMKQCVFIQEQYSIAKCSYVVLFMLLSFEMEDLNSAGVSFEMEDLNPSGFSFEMEDLSPTGVTFGVFSRMLCTAWGNPVYIAE